MGIDYQTDVRLSTLLPVNFVPSKRGHEALAASLGDLGRNHAGECFQRRVDLIACPVPNVDLLTRRLASADDRHIRNLARLRVANFSLHSLGTGVDVNPQTE